MDEHEKNPDIWYFISIENNLRYTLYHEKIFPKILQQQIKYK